MKQITILFFLAANLAAQTTDIDFRVDSMGTTRYYFVTATTYTDASGDKHVQEFQRFFDNKDSVATYAGRVRAAIRLDSATAKTNAVRADSSAARVGRILDKYEQTGGFRSMRIQPPEDMAPAAPESGQPANGAKSKAIRKKRVKNLNKQ
jgi:hypothetical protein